MRVFNRFLAIALFLLILALAVGAAGIATGLLTVAAVDKVHFYEPFHRMLVDFHTSHPQETRVLKVAACGVIALLSFLLVLVELTPPRRERTLRLVKNQDGDVAIGYDTVRKVAELASTEVSGVQRARCRIARDQESLQVRCVAMIDRYANAEVAGGQVEAAIKQQLERTLGRPVQRVNVRVEAQPEKNRVRLK
ncbi:MAG: hypothetical protein NVS4B2_30060 [Chloroflexota bacterium]